MARGEVPRYIQPGSPLAFLRNVPGTRRYYSPAHPETGTISTYRRRQYVGSLSESERELFRQESQRVRRQAATGRSGIRRMFDLRLRAEGRTSNTAEARREFADAYARLLAARYNLRQQTATPLPSDEKDAAYDEMNLALVEVGMRKGDEDFHPTFSPPGYSESIMVPYFQDRIGA
jgi:hypothetical protein